jgi:hypothetical protein
MLQLALDGSSSADRYFYSVVHDSPRDLTGSFPANTPFSDLRCCLCYQAPLKWGEVWIGCSLMDLVLSKVVMLQDRYA